MAKRSRTPHFITGIGNGNVQDVAHRHTPRDNIVSYPFSDAKIMPGGLRSPPQGGNNSNNNMNVNANRNNRKPNLRSRRPPNAQYPNMHEALPGATLWHQVLDRPSAEAMSSSSSVARQSASEPWQVLVLVMVGILAITTVVFLLLVYDSLSSDRRRARRYRPKGPAQESPIIKKITPNRPNYAGITLSPPFSGQHRQRLTLSPVYGTQNQGQIQNQPDYLPPLPPFPPHPGLRSRPPPQQPKQLQPTQPPPISEIYSGNRHGVQRRKISSPAPSKTPRIDNTRQVVQPNFPPIPTLDDGGWSNDVPQIPMINPPSSSVPDQLRSKTTTLHMDELHQMESGNILQWRGQSHDEHLDADDEASNSYRPTSPSQSFTSEYDDYDDDYNDDDEDISIPSNDPRKGIKHKRKNLTFGTNAERSLQSRGIAFEEIELLEVIGGGGFGQVWRATWLGTPVAVKVLTGSAQNTRIARAILEEFQAEINLLKGMRHPNICLYMGASLDPPNRAIITELAANGSVWDALRLPLSPPYKALTGASNSTWPARLYASSNRPPRHDGPSRLIPPVPLKGTWPWELVKHVARGAACGMAYLHKGDPPVLHRDLKSANLLLDESYQTKVCDFGLSRLKSHDKSMTGNCGTVQWMAPEVLANERYNEKADVFSYGIILWELLTRECPFDGMPAIQCALAVLNRDARPEIPDWCNFRGDKS